MWRAKADGKNRRDPPRKIGQKKNNKMEKKLQFWVVERGVLFFKGVKRRERSCDEF